MRREGYSLIELLVVLAALIILGAVLVPTFSGMSRDTRIKAGADAIQARIAEARGAAIEDARPYFLLLSPDGTRVRVAPDENFADAQFADEEESGPFHAEENLPSDVTARAVLGGAVAAPDADGWIRVATFLPDGTCKEDTAVVELNEPGVYPLTIRIRGLTGTSSVAAGPAETLP
jgi:Tfp pilus assembly protein FimT